MAVMVVRPADGLGVRKGKGSQETPGVWLEHLKGQSFHQVSWRRLGKSQSRGPSGILDTLNLRCRLGHPSGDLSELDVCLWRGPGGAVPSQAGCRGLSREPCSLNP